MGRLISTGITSLDGYIADAGADKVVYSSSLAETTTRRTRLERNFDPDDVRRLEAESERDLSIAGPGLAALTR